MENNLETLLQTRKCDTQDGEAMRQHDTFFPKLLSGDLPQFLWKRNYFEGLTDGRKMP